MRTGWKVGIVMAVVALIGAGVVAGVAMADGGKGTGTPAPAPSAVGRAREHRRGVLRADGLRDRAGARRHRRRTPWTAACRSTRLHGRSRPSVPARTRLARSSPRSAATPRSPAISLRGIVGDTAACLDQKGVTISSIADALLGGRRRHALASGRRGGVPARSLLADPLTRSGPDGGHDPPFERWRHPPIATSIRSGEGGRPEAPPVRETGRASRPGLEETTVAGPERIRPSVVLAPGWSDWAEPLRERAPRGSGLASRPQTPPREAAKRPA